MKNYIDLLREVYQVGELRRDRTGTGTKSVFGRSLEFDLRKGFPLVTTKKVNYKAVVEELLWFLRGETNTSTLNSKIWDEWADENGELGPIYGAQWAKQIEDLITNLGARPWSRRHIVDCWQVDDLPDEALSPQENVANGKMALAPCHMMFQLHVSGNGIFLDMSVYQRSQDLFLGGPFNYASYATLMHIIGRWVNKVPRKLIYFIGDAHIYTNHFEQVWTQIQREPYPLPILLFNPTVKSLYANSFTEYASMLEVRDFIISDYNYHPALTGKISV